MTQDPQDESSDQLVAAIEEGMAGEGVADDAPAVPVATEGDDERVDVSTVLGEIGAEEAVAHLEARVQEMEQELGRREQRTRDADRARRGELDLMRARIEDALDLVKTATDEQRAAWSGFESRFHELINEAEQSARDELDELREELSPQVASAIVRLEETEASLRGELRSVTATTEQQSEELAARTSALASELRRVEGELSGRLSDLDEHARAEAGRLEQVLDERISQAGVAHQAATDELTHRLEGLRRELDASAGELRAAVNLRSTELQSEVEALREDTEEHLDDAVQDLEERWIAGTRDIAKRLEDVHSQLRREFAGERESRRAGDDELASRLDEVAGVVEELHTEWRSAGARRHGEDDQVRRELDEVGSRLDVLQSKVASAVGQIASQLTNRVASLSSEQEALRQAASRREERLAALDPLSSRVGELAVEVDRVREAVAAAQDEGRRGEDHDEALRSLRQQLSNVSGTIEAATANLRDLGATVERLDQEAQERAALRQEVRELAARSAELAQRLEETERLARTAGKAIASAVRRSRNQQRAAQTQQPSFFHAEDHGDRGDGPG